MTTLEPLRALVTGSRTWQSPDHVWGALNDVRDEAHIANRRLIVIHGACPSGADAHAARWCATATEFTNGVIEEAHPADWKNSGRQAGFVRNAHMVSLGADVCLAFIRDGSRGASHTARLAEQAGIAVRRWTA